MRFPVAFTATAPAIILLTLTFPVMAQTLAGTGGPGAAAAGEEGLPASMFLHNATRSGSAETLFTVPLALGWRFAIETQGTAQPQQIVASPAYDADTVYFFTGDQMHAVWKETGAKKWDKPLDVPDRIDSTPLIKDGVAVFGCRNGIVYFVELGEKAGRFVGEFNLSREHAKFKKSPTAASQPTRVQSSPLYHDGKVFFGGSDGWVYALDLASQQKVWDFRTKGAIVASPSYWNHGVYVASMDGCVYGLTENSGKLIWKTTLENKDLLASPLVTRSKVFGAAGKYLYACDHGRNGYVRARFEAKGKIVGTPIAAGDSIIFGDTEGKVYCLAVGAHGSFAYKDLENEFILWQVPAEVTTGEAAPEQEVVVDGLQQPVKSTPVIAGDAVVYRSGPRQINAVGLTDGLPVWHYALSELAGQPTAEAQASAAAAAALTTSGAAGAQGLMGAGGAGMETGVGSGRRTSTRGTGASTGTGGRLTRPVVRPTLTFENELLSSPVADGTYVYVVGNDGAAYAFSQLAADNVAPEFKDPEMEIPGQGQDRTQEDMSLFDSPDDIGDDAKKPKVRGALPIYIRVKALDPGSGIDPQTLMAEQVSGDENVKWEVAYDAAGTYAWLICERFMGSTSRNLPDGDYAISLGVSDWFGNQATKTVAFGVDNALAPPKQVTPTRGGPGMPGGMMGPGMPGGMMGPEGGMMGPGMPGGMMGPEGGMMAPGMPGGMPGMPGGMPGMPGMPTLPGMPGI